MKTTHLAPNGTVATTSRANVTHVTLRTYLDKGVAFDGVVAWHKSEAHALRYAADAPSDWSNVRVEAINGGVRS